MQRLPAPLVLPVFLLSILSLITGLSASPLIGERQSITTLSTSQILEYQPYAYFAAAAYCAPSETSTWSCSTNCEQTAGFVPVASGGDGDIIQYWYVGYNPSGDEIIVAHQGTDPELIFADLTDLTFVLLPLDPTLFPGIPASVLCHTGFAAEQAKTAQDVLAAVESAMSTYSTTKVTIVGHSLGAAIALLDSVYLPLWLPSSTTFQTVVFGLPRVGNQEFANYVDSDTPVLTHINNREDPVPILPPMLVGFVHPSGEVHIEDSGSWDACPGQDNPSTLCIVGDVPTVLNGNLTDHDGPYVGALMGSGC